MPNWIPGVEGLSPGELTDGGIDAVDNTIGGTGEFLGGFADGAGNLTDTALGGTADAIGNAGDTVGGWFGGAGDWAVSGVSGTVGDLWSGGTEGVGDGVENVTGGFGTKALAAAAAVAAAIAYAASN